jgi:flavin reductase (DIM6/NTAB) family NADH-FMN oxidoreductase RutF
MIFDISTLENREKYRLLNGGITPRPIAWISTCSNDGLDNLAPFSFFTVASCVPPVLLYTQVTQRSALDKDTLQNLIATEECVVNIVNSPLLEKMSKTSAGIESNKSEFEYANIETSNSYKVRPLSVKASPIRYECTLREVIRISDEPAGGTVVLLDVKYIYVRDDLYTDEHINQELVDSVGKMGGDGYTHNGKYVELGRP